MERIKKGLLEEPITNTTTKTKKRGQRGPYVPMHHRPISAICRIVHQQLEKEHRELVVRIMDTWDTVLKLQAGIKKEDNLQALWQLGKKLKKAIFEYRQLCYRASRW